MNHFLLKPTEYTRDIDILGAYAFDCASYLSRMTGDSFDKCLAYIKHNTSAEGKFPYRDPSIRYLQRDKNGDRSLVETGTFRQYLQMVADEKRLISPTMAVYENPRVKKSLLATYIDVNLKKRKGFKHDMFVNEMEGNVSMMNFFDNLQNSCKIKNNSLSGAHASSSTILYNKSSHSTLTSTCRSAASYGNAHNEKFIMGNRHYWSPDIVIANILNICKTLDVDSFMRVMDTFQLHYPTPEETMECITYSTNLYWRNYHALNEIQEFVSKLLPHERAAVVYIGDFYHLCKYNQDFVRNFLFELTQVATHSISVEDTDKILKSVSGDFKTYVTLLCSDIMEGRLMNKVKEETPEQYGVVGATAIRVQSVLDSYQLLITGLWRMNTMPSSIANIESMVRRCVVVSDTDSTIFTTQHWTMWFAGKLDFSRQSYAISYAVTFLTSQVVAHLLAKMSANIGIIDEQIHQLVMKNEYFFPTFSVTPRAKHYFAYIAAREGNVFKKMKMEIKGVEMRSSTAPPETMAMLNEYMQDLMNKVMKDGSVSVHDVLGPVARLEKQIVEDIRKGGFKYMRMMQIKDASSYVAGEDAAPIVHHNLWQTVFAPKYGQCSPPPYPVIKVSVAIDRPRAFKKWMSEIQDKDLAQRLQTWMEVNQKDKITLFMLPLELLELNGIPSEVIDAIDMRQLIFNVMSPFYLVLESLGFYMINDKLTRLVSDTYTPA